MNSIDLETVLKSNVITSKYFMGIYSIDTIPCLSTKTDGFYIVNNDKKNGLGE